MLYSLIFTTLLSYLFIKLIITYAIKLHLTDIPNERSTHFETIPLGAGIGFIIAMLIGIVSYNPSIMLEHWYIFVAILIVLCVGMVDDIYEASPKTKIMVIVLAGLLLWYHNISIITLGEYFGYQVSLGWLSLPFSVFAIVGFTNALNLIDGIDGLAGMVSLVIIASFGYIGYNNEDLLIFTLSGFSIASVIAFILLNYHPAKIFMGDSGSLTLGFIIATLAILSLKYIHPIVALYFTALPLFDTFTVIIRRVKNGMPIFQPDQTHFHHLLLKYFGDRDKEGKRVNRSRRTVWVLVAFQALFSLIGLQIHYNMSTSSNMSIFALMGFIIVFILVYMLITKIENFTQR